jgi:hypothetical protein
LLQAPCNYKQLSLSPAGITLRTVYPFRENTSVPQDKNFFQFALSGEPGEVRMTVSGKRVSFSLSESAENV